MSEVFVGALGRRDPNAYARAYGEGSRVICIHAGLYNLIRVYSIASAFFFEQFRDYMTVELAKADKQRLPIDKALELMEYHGNSFLAARSSDETIQALSKALAAVRSGEHDPLPSRLRETINPDLARPLALAALHFVLAHEYSHHLLGHTVQSSTVSRAPGQQVLQTWIAALGYEIPIGSNGHQKAEFEADALGLYLSLTATSQDAIDADTYGRSLFAIGGATSALATLTFVADLGGDIVEPLYLQGHGADSHPPLRERLVMLGELSVLAGSDHPEGAWINEQIGRPVSRRPEGFALQLWACGAFLESLAASV